MKEQSDVPKLELNQLKVFGPVGRGAKGVVFHVKIDGLGDDLALKVVLKSAAKGKGDGNCNGGEVQNRVLFEQQVLTEFNHPLLPTIKGVIETENVFGYAIDYCPGGNLNSLRKQQVEKMFSDDIIRFYGAEIVLALEYLHKKGIVYRDLKPENVLIQENGHLMLVDFDLSTKLVPKSPKSRSSFESSETPERGEKKKKLSQLPKFLSLSRCSKSGILPKDDSFKSSKPMGGSSSSFESDYVGKSNSFVGTEEYVAPEIIRGHGHDFAVDWWSYGIVLHEMLYGTTPFRGENRKETFYKILSKEPELVGETTPLRDLIRKLLEKDPKQRISLEEIKGHDFFKGVDWDMIQRLERPPHIPYQQDLGEGIIGNEAIDVESVVYGIFKKEVPKNISDEKCEENKCDKNSDKNICEESIKRSVWVDGLEQPSISGNFLVF